MRACNRIQRLVVPSDITLTPRVLIAAICKFPTNDIEIVVQNLIDELDLRWGNSDFEMEPIEEDDPESCSSSGNIGLRSQESPHSGVGSGYWSEGPPVDLLRK